MQESPEKAVYAERYDQNDAVFGCLTVHNASLFRRGWYRSKGTGLVLALYQCKADQFTAAGSEIEEASL